MKKALKKTYDEHQDEQLEIEAEKREATRKAVVASLATSGPLSAKALGLEYAQCDFIRWNGVKGGGNSGYGWCEFYLPAQLILIVEVLGGKLEIRVDGAFKESLGRLTPKRRALIRQAMPSTVSLVLGAHPKNGDRLILVTPQALGAWANDVKDQIARSSSRETA